MATPTQGKASPSKEILNEQQGGKLLETEKEAAMEMHGAADIEDTDWSRAPIDVQTNYRIEKKLTIPLKLFGTTKDIRHIPSSLSRVVAVQHEGGEAYPIELGSLELKYEESHGRTRLHLLGPGASDVLSRFKGHRITGWSLCEPSSGAAVMHINPPTHAPPSSADHEGSNPHPSDDLASLEEDEEDKEVARGLEEPHALTLTSAGGEAGAGSKEVPRLRVILRRGNLAATSAAGGGGTGGGAGGGALNSKAEAEGRVTTRGQVSSRRTTPDPHEMVKAEPWESGGPHPGTMGDDEEYQMDEDEVLEGDEDIINDRADRGGNKDPNARRSSGRINRLSRSAPNPNGLPQAQQQKKAPPGPPSAALIPIGEEGIAGFSLSELKGRKLSHTSTAVLGNNNLSLPQTLFGGERTERVFPEKCQVLALVDNGLDPGVFDLGIFRLNINPYNPGQSSNGTRMKVTLGASGTLYKRFRDQLSIYGWSKLNESKPCDESLTVIIAHMKVFVAPPAGGGGGGGGGAGQAAASAAHPSYTPPPPQRIQDGSRPKLISNGGGQGLKRAAPAGLQSMMSDDLIAAADTLAFLSDPKRPRVTTATPAGATDAGGRFYEPTIHPAYAFREGPSGLPVLPDLATTSGTAFMTRTFLHIYNLLKLSPQSKAKLMQVMKETLMNKEGGASYIECVYSFLQDACASGDKSQVLAVLKESFGAAEEESTLAVAATA